MAITKLSCPDCGTVLRPAKPVEAGKKVKCPKCELIFVAGEDDEDEPPRRSPAKGGKAKKGAPAVKAAPKKKDEEETYGFIKDDDEDDEDAKPRIDYAPDESIRDLRGPAIVKLTPPGSKLQLVGMAGVLGWMALFILLLIPTVFPIQADEKEKAAAQAQPQQQGAAKKAEENRPPFFGLFGLDLGGYFLILMVPMILCMVYSSMVVAGGIKMVNLESRAFGIVGAIMAMIPLHVAGIQTVATLLLTYMGWLLLDDADFGQYIAMAVSAIVYLLSLAVGIWSLMALMDQDVIDGFEFNPD
jgi:phage FluMu protein Com